MFQKIKNYKLKNKKGFTLIEVLVVVSIIGLLSAVILVGLGGFRTKSRNTRRITDLKSIQNGLELYYNKNNQYPDDYEAVINAGLGITKLPKDPSSAGKYLYSVCGTEKQAYVLGATLEDAAASDPVFKDSDQQVFNLRPECSPFSGGCTPPNYCVSL